MRSHHALVLKRWQYLVQNRWTIIEAKQQQNNILEHLDFFQRERLQNQWNYNKRVNVANAKISTSTKSGKSIIVEDLPNITFEEISINSPEYKNNLYAATDQYNELLSDLGTLIVPKTDVVSSSEITVAPYRRVEAIPLKSVISSEITYHNYTHNLLYPSSNIASRIQQQFGVDNRQNEPLGIAGFVTSMAGWLILPIPCGVVGIILSGISMAKINKNPDKFKGKGFAIAGLVVGIVVAVLGIILLGAALSLV